MKKILIIRDKILSYNGGINRHCNELKLLMSGYDSLEILPIKDLPCEYIKCVRKHKYDMDDLLSYIKDSQCDVVHIHGFMSFGTIQAIIAAKKLRKKIVYSPHFHPFKYLNNPNLGRLWFYMFLRPLLKDINSIVTINNEDTLYFSKYNSNVVRIPHWRTSEKWNQNLIKKSNNIILFIGRNDKNKGIEHLYHLPEKYEVHCVCKGKILRKDFFVHQNLTDEELGNLYNRAAAVVVPSRYEAFSLVALEALERHTPIVISDRVRIADYIQEEKGIVIFKYRDYDSFNKAVEEAINQTKVDYQSILNSFDSQKIRAQYYDLYMNL